MATATQKVARLGNSLDFLDGVALKSAQVQVGPEADKSAARKLRDSVRNRADATVPVSGASVTFGAIFAGTPFAGITGTVTPSGITRSVPRAGKRSVVVDCGIKIGATRHYCVPAGYLTVAD